MAALIGFPFTTPYDPSQDPATSVDPLGTASLAERLADAVLPGFTARMWRARLLTMSAVTSLVAHRAAQNSRSPEVFEPTRLAFERMFVSSIAQQGVTADAGEGMRRIPGIERARRALAHNEPLTRANFLKGQSVNGPTGTLARLARSLQLTDGENHLASKGPELAIAWAKDNKLGDILDDSSKWIDRMANAAAKAADGDWPGKQSSLWGGLFETLRPDRLGAHERSVLERLLRHEGTGTRARVFELLVQAVDVFSAHRSEGRSSSERMVMQDGLLPQLGTDPVDTLIRVVLEAVDISEHFSSHLQGAFDVLRWALSSKGVLGEAEVLADHVVAVRFEQTRAAISHQLPRLAKAIDAVDRELSLDRRIVPQLQQLYADAQTGATSSHALLLALLDRHQRVQKEKRKGDWVERGQKLTLMPGFGFDNASPDYTDLYLHPFRIPNAYLMLDELGVVEVGADEEEE